MQMSGFRGKKSSVHRFISGELLKPCKGTEEHVIGINGAHHLPTLLPEERQQAWGMLLVDYMILLTGSRLLKATENREDFSFGVKEFSLQLKENTQCHFYCEE